MRVPGFSRIGLGGWSDDPLWGTVYDWTVEHPRLGGALWAVGIQSDLRKLYAAAAETGGLPAGSAVLDVPCGGGVALRGLRPGQGVRYVAADIAQKMLDRTLDAALERGLEDQVEQRLADVGELAFADDEFDLVVSFTGLHCFPDPARAVVEMVRVLRPGGVLTGSAILNDTGLRFTGLRLGGRASGLLGPSCTTPELLAWLVEAGLTRVRAETSGALVYFRAVKPG